MLTYRELIEQTFYFPTPEFNLRDNILTFHGVSMMDIASEYKTPLKLNYLPKIGENIRKATEWFSKAIKKEEYQGSYTYAYCTKSSHFSFVLENSLAAGAHIETSSSFDISIVRKLIAKGLINKDIYIICNGFKVEEYKQHIVDLINDGFRCIPILDNKKEFAFYAEAFSSRSNPVEIGLRVASDETPQAGFYTSRLGIRPNDILPFYEESIKNNEKLELHMLHYFVSSGIKDTSYYWKELGSFVEMYIKLRKVCPTLSTIDIGGGIPIKTSLGFSYEYQYMIEEIVKNIKRMCDEEAVPVPNLITEFGSYTVGESGAVLYKILDQKQQNDKELWYMIDSSFITTLPDIWGLNQKFILLALNHWDKKYHRVSLGGLTCDNLDYYNSEAHIGEVYLPKVGPDEELYVGFFHTGAYQESIGGYGGIQHCLVPAPKHLLLDKTAGGEVVKTMFREQQAADQMLSILGY